MIVVIIVIQDLVLHNTKKQPIIIDDDEKAYIDARDKEIGVKSYDESIRYGTGEKKYNYICPRFWCIRDNKGKGRSLSLKQINDGECGGWNSLIPEGAKKVPPGKRIVEFVTERFHRENVKNTEKGDPARRLIYRPMYPGFQDTDKHPKGLCVPCCFQGPKQQVYESFTDEKGNKKYRIIETGEILDSPPKIPYMYKPRPKPTFETDGDGNIILDSIKGELYERQNGIKNEAYNTCHQPAKESKKTEGQDEKDDSIPSTESNMLTKKKKLDDLPLNNFPLRTGQLGYMNIALQKFLGFNNKQICYNSDTDKKLKKNEFCILRLGIEKNKKQSFICLLASIYKNFNKFDKDYLTNEVESLQEFKEYFIENLTMDKFVIAKNGNLVNIFETDDIESIDYSKYNDSIYLRNVNNDKVKKKTVSSYENFINYFMDSNVTIDYTYLWDFVCKPTNSGGVLFKEGINLLLFNSPNDDIIDKIELICPGNNYNGNIFDYRKKTLLCYTKNNYYEPLCKIKKTTRRGNFNISLFFRSSDFDVFKDTTNIVTIIAKIKETYLKNCISKKVNEKYKYLKNKNLNEYKLILGNLEYSIKKQLINYNNQVIGLIIEKDRESLYLPILPSSIDFEYDFELINSFSNYNSFEKTISELKNLFNVSNKKVLCKPLKKIVDDGMIVGIITITNQFVPILPEKYEKLPVEVEDLKVVFTKGLNNQLNNDQDMLLSNSVDEERILITKKVKLENNFYNLFRNTLKILVNYTENKEIKNNILEIINNLSIGYIDKIRLVREQMHIILDPVIIFQKIQLEDIDDYDNLITCLGLKKETCDTKSHCLMRTVDGICKFIIPENNLFNENSNKKIYFNKISDELVRYSKIRNYILTPRTFLSFNKVNYRINEDEIILLEEILLDKYLENIKLRKRYNFINNYSVYDSTNPAIDYNIKKFKLESKSEMNIDCIVDTDMKIGKYIYNIILKDYIDESIEFEQFNNTSFCSGSMIKSIIKHNGFKEKISIQNIKKILYEKYIQLITPSETDLSPIRNQLAKNWTIFSIMNWYANQKSIVENVYNEFSENKNKEIQTQIFTENYYFTIFDLLIIFKYYKIPVILKMSSSQGFQTNANMSYFSTVTNENKYVFILLVSKKKKEYTNNYGIVKYNNSYKIPIVLINNEKIQLINNNISIKDFITKSISYLEKRQRINRKNDLKAKNKKRGKVVKLKNKKKLVSNATASKAKTPTASKTSKSKTSKTPTASKAKTPTASKTSKSKTSKTPTASKAKTSKTSKTPTASKAKTSKTSKAKTSKTSKSKTPTASKTSKAKTSKTSKAKTSKTSKAKTSKAKTSKTSKSKTKKNVTKKKIVEI